MNFTVCTCKGCGAVGVLMFDGVTRCPECLLEVFSIEEIDKMMEEEDAEGDK